MKLNDYDLNILNNNSYREIDDESLKIKLLISEKEEILTALQNKIKGMELLGKLLDVMELKIQAKNLEKEISDLKEQYAKRNISEKLTDTITGTSIKPKVKAPLLTRLQKFLTRILLPKVSKKFKSIKDLSDSLETLSSINKNIDELIALKAPYGETAKNYEKLTAYLYNANKIHSKINKKMNNIG